MIANINPYWGTSFFSFFQVLFYRLCHLDQIYSDMASDEMQIFVLAATAISCSIVGAFLVVRKMTMLANSMSHTILLGMIITFFMASSFSTFYFQPMSLHLLFISSIVTALLTSFFTKLLIYFFKLQEDASIGLVFTSLFALGIVLTTTLARDSHLSTDIIMGNADFLQWQDLKISLVVLFINVCIVFLFFPHLQLFSFDEQLSKMFALPRKSLHLLLMMQTSLSVLGGFRSVGVVLILTFLVGPVLIAKIFCKSLKKVILYASILGLVSSIIAVALSRHILSVYQIPLSTGSLLACLITFIYFLILFFPKMLFHRREEKITL